MVLRTGTLRRAYESGRPTTESLQPNENRKVINGDVSWPALTSRMNHRASCTRGNKTIDVLEDRATCVRWKLATGLDLSVSTLRNLKHLKGAEPKIEPIPEPVLEWQAFAEVLGVDSDTAIKLYQFAVWERGRQLEDIQGLSPYVIERAKAALIFH